MPFAGVNGVRLYYEIFGEGEPVVFIHGVGITSRVWDFQREAVSCEFKMIVYGLRGSGKSGKTPEVFHSAEPMKGNNRSCSAGRSLSLSGRTGD